jgi:hypothetical protein
MLSHWTRRGPHESAACALALKDARKGKVLLLPLDVVVDSARAAGLQVHVSERRLSTGKGD